MNAKITENENTINEKCNYIKEKESDIECLCNDNEEWEQKCNMLNKEMDPEQLDIIQILQL